MLKDSNLSEKSFYSFHNPLERTDIIFEWLFSNGGLKLLSRQGQFDSDLPQGGDDGQDDEFEHHVFKNKHRHHQVG